MQLSARLTAVALASSLLLAACGGGGGSDDDDNNPPPGAAVGDTVALTASGKLVSFDRAAPGTQVSSLTITGLERGDTLVGIDRRPADGKLYAVGSMGTVYALDPRTGAATLTAELRAVTDDDRPFTGLSGTSFAVDFNPSVDRLRVVSNTGQNLRINVETGATTTDTDITPAGAEINAGAYTNGFAGTTGTRLYVIDAAAGRLYLQQPANDGTLDAGVALGVRASASNGFDIDPRTNKGYAALTVDGVTALYEIDLDATGGAATRVGAIEAGGEAIRGMALAAVDAPRAFGLTDDNRLLAFNPDSPNRIRSTTAVTGLRAGEVLRGIDFRPRDGKLYGVTNAGRLYTIDEEDGDATEVASLSADPGDNTAPFAGIDGTITSVDFNPAADRLRVITSSGQNLRIVVETATANGATVTAGHTTTDGTINRAGAAPSVIASAYSNNFAGTATTALYNIEQNSDQLTQQTPPNDGTLVDRGPLGLDVADSAGFDIAGGANGLPLAALRAGSAGPFSLYQISLTDGRATLYDGASASRSRIGGVGGPANLIDLAIRL
ncbi:MAG: DUF4394 domain-containing protein [Ramlibacter sp.]